MFMMFNPLFAITILKTNKSYEYYTHKSMQTRINQVQTDGNKTHQSLAESKNH